MAGWVLVQDLSMMGEGTTAAGDEKGNGEGDGGQECHIMRANG
jgi:hypothetical protein